MAGELVHYELQAANADRAQQFWGGLFGWQFQGSGMPDVDYRMAQIDDRSGAAIFQTEEPKGHPNVYLSTDDIDASLAKVRELGGEAEDKGAIPEIGWQAACRDTEGNPFRVFQSDESVQRPQ